jgi:hypothetical protein
MARYPLNAEPIRLWVIAPLLAAAVFFAPVPAWVVDQFYSRDMYPWLQSWFTAFSNLLPFAVLDLLIALALVAVVLRGRRLLNVSRERGVMDAMWETIRRVVRAVSIVALLFLWGWGCNYRRLPLEQALPDRTATVPTPELLRAAVLDANALAARLHPIAAAGKGMTYDEIAEALPKPMDAALKVLGRTPLLTPGRPKYSVVLTPFFTRAGISGMVNPLSLESIVHPDLLPFERPFVLAHEWAHLAGQADEAEASAIGWLACMNGLPVHAYSASLYLIMEAAAALPSDTRQTLVARLDPGVRADLDAIGRRMQQESPLVQRTASRVYDEYLRGNGVADGTTSYRRALSLILTAPLKDLLATYGAQQ